jgi:CDK-activating kinase assembly factor MAT1
LSSKSIEEIEVEKDLAVRRQVKTLFNKTEADFGDDLNTYKDYEEMVEDIIYNLVQEIDVPETKAKIEKYKKENSDLIARNQLKLNQQMKEEMNQIKEEEFSRMQKNMEFQVNFIRCSSFIFPSANMLLASVFPINWLGKVTQGA